MVPYNQKETGGVHDCVNRNLYVKILRSFKPDNPADYLIRINKDSVLNTSWRKIESITKNP